VVGGRKMCDPRSYALWVLFYYFCFWFIYKIYPRAKSNNACMGGSADPHMGGAYGWQADSRLIEIDHPMPNMEESFWAHARRRSRFTMSFLAEQGSTAVQGAMTTRLDGIMLSMQACLDHLEAGLPPPAAASVLSAVINIPDDVISLLENPPQDSDDGTSDEVTIDPPPELPSQETPGTRRPFALSLASVLQLARVRRNPLCFNWACFRGAMQATERVSISPA
jgi:hypothetical protein